MKLVWPLLVLFIFNDVESTTLRIKRHDLPLRVGETANFTAVLSNKPNTSFYVSVIEDNSKVLDDIEPYSRKVKRNETQINYMVKAKEAGHVTVILNASNEDIDTTNAFIRISVRKNLVLDIISQVVGWLYFVAWSISFYPQIYINWRRKSVVGLNFDFLSLNITGFACYSIFNCGMLFISEIKDEYLFRHPTGVIPVEVNDAVFALHASVATVVTIIQCCLYERGNQRVSNISLMLLLAIWGGGAVLLILTVSGLTNSYPWLTFVYYFSYVKLGITLIKYIPQAYYNFSRKSTEGWSIGNVILDFTGGLLSMFQMFIIAFNYDDWLSLFGNFTKFALGVISILFDILFILQHYVFYKNYQQEELPILAAGSEHSSYSSVK